MSVSKLYIDFSFSDVQALMTEAMRLVINDSFKWLGLSDRAFLVTVTVDSASSRGGAFVSAAVNSLAVGALP